jgi:TorA-specific chaperone
MMAIASTKPLMMRADVAAGAAAWLAGIFIAPLTLYAVAEQLSSAGTSLLAAMGDALHCQPSTDGMRLALTGSASVRATMSHLGRAYTRLFEGVSGPATIPLYESAYTAMGNRLFQASTGQIESLLQRRGLSVARECGEPPDHLSVELALLSSAMRDGDRSVVHLVNEHLSSWVPKFCAQCEVRDTTGYYGGAAVLLNRFVVSTAMHGIRRAA